MITRTIISNINARLLYDHFGGTSIEGTRQVVAKKKIKSLKSAARSANFHYTGLMVVGRIL